jgi:hypothetical protein
VDADIQYRRKLGDIGVLGAIDASFPGLAPMCPNTSKFTASDPKGKEDPFGWVKEPCTPARYTSRYGPNTGRKVR